MKTTRYFEDQVLRKRPYIERDWCERTPAKPLRREIQQPGTQAREIGDGVVADFDGDGNVVGLDIEHASTKLDLSKIETIALPAVKAVA